jgi:hypothetical protein
LPEPAPSSQPDPVDPATESLPAAESRSDTPPVTEASLADTSGMGTIVAIGCIGATLFLIVLGLIYIAVVQLVG